MSREDSPPEFLIVGRVVAPWGRRGEVKVEVVSDFPDRFAAGQTVYVDSEPLRIEDSRFHRQHVLLKFAGIDSIEEAQKLRQQGLTIPLSQARELLPDEFYIFQLVGLDVLTADGQALGRIIDVMATGSNDVYVVAGERGEILIPAIEDVVLSIDLDKGRVLVEPIEGLLR